MISDTDANSKCDYAEQRGLPSVFVWDGPEFVCR